MNVRVLRRHNAGVGKVPYTEDMAYKDWAPYSYLDGFHGDLGTKGSTNERAWLAPARDSSKGLEVLLPKGCVTGACAMQVKNVLQIPVESATLKFKCVFSLLREFCRSLNRRRSTCSIIVILLR
jgi:hypothetical protein